MIYRGAAAFLSLLPGNGVRSVMLTVAAFFGALAILVVLRAAFAAELLTIGDDGIFVKRPRKKAYWRDFSFADLDTHGFIHLNFALTESGTDSRILLPANLTDGPVLLDDIEGRIRQIGKIDFAFSPAIKIKA